MGRFTDAFQQADNEFKAQHSLALNQLKGLSETEIKSIVPQGTSSEEYKNLVAVVEDAVKKNIGQAELVANIKSLGSNVVNIAKKIPMFASLL